MRDAAIEAVGNPWLRRQAWDADVLDGAGRPDDQAREMVLGWLRQKLIKDFFELLSEDRAADTRRLVYWLRFEPAIEDMWFVLGGQARRSSDRDYVDFRRRARGRVLGLSGQTNPTNNAFIMRIGDHVAVEFGMKGNAFFLCGFEDLPKLVKKKLLSGSDNLEIDIEDLRRGLRLIHRDRPTAQESWEEQFDQKIVSLLSHRPDDAPFSLRRERSKSEVVFHPKAGGGSSAPAELHLFSWLDLERYVTNRRLRVEDHRRKGGAYWVLADDGDIQITNQLRSWGFRYKAGRGWWKE